MRFHVAIFDVDGVLVDSPHERAWREALQHLMQDEWRDLAWQTSYAPERFTSALYQVHVAGKPREAGASAVLDYFAIPDLDGQRQLRYAAAKQSYVLELIQRGEFTAFADALGFLLELKARGLRIAAASSSKNANLLLGKVNIEAFSARSERHYPFVATGTTLLDLFDVNVCGRDFARGKPDPEIFLAAAAELGLSPAQCVVVEDAPAGVQAAKAGGMACIGVARLGDEQLLSAAGADLVVTQLAAACVDWVTGTNA